MEKSADSTRRLVIGVGTTVIVWDCLEERELMSFSPKEEIPVADVAWNHNGQVLASSSAVSTDETDHHTVTLTAAHSGKKLDSFQHNQAWKRPAGETTSIAFGGKSRYLCLGDTSGAVCLWDLKKKLRVRQFFHEEHPSRQVALDPTDKFIISLSDKLISVFNLREGSLASTISPSGNYTFTCFDISIGDPGVLAVGTSDGNIILHDITKEDTPIITFLRRCHSTFVTQLAISPQNSQLLASTSIDGTLKFFDTTTGEAIHQLAALNSAITKLAVHGDGVVCAVGTEKGDIYLYDMRQSNPLSSFQVEGPISCLRFAPLPKQKGEDSTATTDLHDGKRNDAPLAMAPSPSPVPFIAPSPATTTTTTTSRDSEGDKKTSPNRLVAEVPKPAHRFPEPAMEDDHPPSRIVSTPKYIHQRPSDAQNAAPDSSPGESQPGNDFSSSPAHRGGVDGAIIAELDDKIDLVRNTIDGIKSSVQDEIDHLRDDMEESIRNMHMDMLTQFHQQSQEVKKAFKEQQDVLKEFMEENRRLREENQALKQQSM